MSGFIEGDNRQQATLLPELLDDYTTDENAVRVVDVFIDSLNLTGLGFKNQSKNNGPPWLSPLNNAQTVRLRVLKSSSIFKKARARGPTQRGVDVAAWSASS